MNPRISGLIRLVFAVFALAAVGAQFFFGLQRETFVIANFFSFFTVESNLIAALVFLVTGFAVLRLADIDRFALLRGAATLYMTATGYIFFAAPGPRGVPTNPRSVGQHGPALHYAPGSTDGLAHRAAKAARQL